MADVLNTQGLAAALAADFAAVIEAALGQPLSVSTGPAATGRGWGTPVTATGLLTGTVTAYVDVDGARAVAAQVMHLADEPDESIVAGLLRELWGQAAHATSGKDAFQGLTLSVGAPMAGDIASGSGAWVLSAGDAAMATLSLEGRVVPGAVAAAAASTAASPDGVGSEAGATAASPGNLAALLDIDLPLVVRFARTELSLRALTELGPGSMIDMGRAPDDPVQLLVGSQVIAEGEVVVVAGNYGVRITSLVSPAERLRAMQL